jgi:hypothetical protein
VIRAHQPGSEPLDIPEVIPNPVVVPEQTPMPSEPAPRKPVETPEKVPADYAPVTTRRISSLPISRAELSGGGKQTATIRRALDDGGEPDAMRPVSHFYQGSHGKHDIADESDPNIILAEKRNRRDCADEREHGEYQRDQEHHHVGLV